MRETVHLGAHRFTWDHIGAETRNTATGLLTGYGSFTKKGAKYHLGSQSLVSRLFFYFFSDNLTGHKVYSFPIRNLWIFFLSTPCFFQ